MFRFEISELGFSVQVSGSEGSVSARNRNLTPETQNRPFALTLVPRLTTFLDVLLGNLSRL